MLAVRNGDLRQLGQLFERHHQHLYNFFLKHTSNREFSEDLVQDVFLRMLKYRHTYRGEGKFTTWMYRIAVNARIDAFRKFSADEQPLETALSLRSEEPNPDELTEQDCEIALLRKALGKLSPEKREVLILSRFQGLKYEAIAEISGCKIGTIKARVFRALKELSQIFFELSGEALP
ncbi:RNA polymerase sigma factor [candidate division KSB1 bacterium]|nr:RNA polymerase sigma factor [candidate division KSB1 bacterium]